MAGKDKQSQNKAANIQPINQTMCVKIFEYVTNIDNIKLKATDIATAVGLGERQIYRYLTKEFWEKVKEERRKRYAKHSVFVDEGLVRSAVKGNPQAARLFYERYEDWASKTKLEHSGPGGKPIQIEAATITTEMSAKEASKIYAQMVKNGG